ncbi:Translation initiation factor 2 (IF-2; GTPase) (plasmid) [Allorhizobium ampelinum S4]|uniref:Translation initiation factor 2 (IF-2 GTPase) n=1 Tax=Allorhizobium ampelinum (strain ATCC BAA-846 / DSM 112012 / S4) TaxID=311402 RepID=B9K3C5_ALLAM|nr:Translation initiation factor 2 (IF-2; GTPase) [Allorhizobium ampelinum S4]ACM39398.1 Translation initiation factor 2 (IF-2; GTPase) [Allorhizobium ampelinum S4]
MTTRKPIPLPTRRKTRTTGSAAMSRLTGAQRSYLKTLSEQAHQPDTCAEDLTKAEASKRIDELKQSLDLE